MSPIRNLARTERLTLSPFKRAHGMFNDDKGGRACVFYKSRPKIIQTLLSF